VCTTPPAASPRHPQPPQRQHPLPHAQAAEFANDRLTKQLEQQQHANQLLKEAVAQLTLGRASAAADAQTARTALAAAQAAQAAAEQQVQQLTAQAAAAEADNRQLNKHVQASVGW
jgi:hypothetical protein